MKRKVVSILLVGAMCAGMLAGCGSSSTSDAETGGSSATEEASTSGDDDNVLEFYHGYYQDESEWAAAQVMRDIYEEFAEEHADGNVTFKAIAVENRDEIVSAQVAGGSFPDMVDFAGSSGGGALTSAIAQGLVYDLKPFIDENDLVDAVGLNYTQNDKDGHIYSVHDQIESRGLWYNSSILEAAGLTADSVFADWTSFGEAMDKVNALGGDTYGYIAGQGSRYIVNALLGSTESGQEMLSSELTEDTINSEEFANAFKTAAKLDQANGSGHTTDDNGNLMADFNTNGTVGVLFNGVWNASAIDEANMESINSTLFPGNVAIASAGNGISIASGMSDEKTELALEFIEYMTSAEVQERIFTEVQAKPCNTTVDLTALAEESDDAAVAKLAEACSQVNDADITVIDLSYTWGSDVDKAIINALMESAVSGADIDSRFEQLQNELLALIE